MSMALAKLIVNDRFVELGGIEDGIVLNGVIQEACQGEVLQNGKMEGDFPALKPGNDLISRSGDITRVIIAQNRWN